MIKTFRVEGFVPNRVTEVTWDYCRSSYAELTSDVIISDIYTIVVYDSGSVLDSCVTAKCIESNRRSRSAYFMSRFGIGLPTLPVKSFSGHLILVTMQVASVIPGSR